MSDSHTFDAIVLAEGATAHEVLVGLTLAERARRVAVRAGARRVRVVESAADRAGLTGWWDGGAVLVIRAVDQMVHSGLCTDLVAGFATALAVVPPAPAATDLAPGSYAGALFANGDDAATVIDALAAGDDDRALAARLAPHAAAIAHGAIARHPATTRDERRAAARLLYRILHKPQDNAITRYLFRPVSAPLTRLFVRTPITPNQISLLTAVMIGVGLWLTAQGGMDDAIAGTAIVLAATYIDCCDGEVARLKLLSSKLGAWLDTVIDELSSVGYLIAIGIHCARWYGDDYLPWFELTVIGVIAMLMSIYVVYYNLIVVVGSANSQDYVGRFEEVDGDQPGTVRLRPAPPRAPGREPPAVVRWFATYAPYVLRRDFIAWMTLVLAALHQTHVSFLGLAGGAVGASLFLGADHLRLVLQRRAIARRGLELVR